MIAEQPTRLDPVTLEVLRNAFPAIADEMSVDLQRTSYNMMIYEIRDYCCALLDAEGRLISQNIGGVSHFVADLGVVIKDGVQRFGRNGFAPGDVILMNHQRVSGQHLNNVCIYTPFFVAGELTAFAIVRAHWGDVGGMSTGFGANNVADPWIEGLQFDQLKVYEAGVPDAKLLQMIRDNIRYPDAAMGDMRSQIAACKLAERRLEELYARYGRELISRSIETIFDETERKCRLVVGEIPDGVYEAESYMDSDGIDRNATVPLRVTVTVSGTDMTMDLTKSSLERKGGMNARTLAAPYIAYKGITGPLDPVNEGSFRALKVEIQEGNMLMARFPAPMAGWSRALPTMVDTIVKALAPALPDRTPGAHLGTLGGGCAFFGRDPKSGKAFVLQTIEGGGWGGRPWQDGPSASVSVCQGDVRNTPIETIELKSPVRVDRRSLREGSGGAGKFRGGLGQLTQFTNLVEGSWNLSNNGRRKLPPWGVFGGGSGRASVNRVRRTKDEPFAVEDPYRALMPAGASVIVETAGGGGWGDPFEREPARVLDDVLEGLISMEAAGADYGVVIRADRTVDDAATATLRGERR
ncbi:MAG: hydantoinase B/oxoprolinase family protein [Candidatus Lustribacter sp.]